MAAHKSIVDINFLSHLEDKPQIGLRSCAQLRDQSFRLIAQHLSIKSGAIFAEFHVP
jgi:hypothetical protein